MKKFNEKYLYLYRFIGGCMPIFGFYQLLFLENGLSITGVTILIAIWNATVVLAEIPTGIIADKFSRRNLLVFSSLIQGTGFLIWFFASGFWTFALGFILWGIAEAMVSGAESSLIYDNLKFDEKVDKFTEIFGKAEFWGNIGVIVAIISAGILISFVSPATMALVSSIICLVNAGVALGIREKNYYCESLTDGEPEGTLKDAISFFKTNTLAFLFGVFLVIFASMGSYLEEFDAFIAIDFDRGNVWIAVVLAIRFAFVAVGDLLAPWFEKKLKSNTQIIFISLIGYAILGVFAFIWYLFALVLFGLSFMFLAIAGVLTTQKLQSEVKEEGRATIMSFVGLSQALMMILVSLVFGALAGVFTIRQVYFIFIAFGIVGGLVMVPLVRRF